MSDNTNYNFLWEDPYQLDQVDLHSPELPVDGNEPLSEPLNFKFGDYLEFPEEESDFQPQAKDEEANTTESRPTQVEFPRIIADIASANPNRLTNDFIGNVNPASVSNMTPSNFLAVDMLPDVPRVPAPFEYPATYRHDVLNSFPDSTYPLHIIDGFGSLSQEVLGALQQGLKRQREHDAEINQLLSSMVDPTNIEPPFNPLLLEQSPAKKRKVAKGKSVAVPVAEDNAWYQEEYALSDAEPEIVNSIQEPAKEPEAPVKPAKVPGKKWIKPNHVTQGKNKRSRNIQSLNPADYYMPLEQQPESWGTPNLAGTVPFHYTEEGELKPHIRLSVAQMKEFIFNHPGHNISGVRHTKHSGLTIWIQSVPSDSAARYPNQNSDKCRFADCPVGSGTIHKGSYRVAFDEQSSDPVTTDPFFNAGHTHLYCLEKFLDFPFICANFNVQPDNRALPEGRNKMAITRDHVEMRRIVKRFVRNAEKAQATAEDQGVAFISSPRTYENTLCYQLTIKHLELEPPNRQNMRNRRPNANSLDKHFNNLDIYVAGNIERRENRTGRYAPGRPSIAPPALTQEKSKKRKPDEDSDSEFEIHEDVIIVDTHQAKSSTAQSTDERPAKKARCRRSTKKIIDDSDSYEDSSDDNNNDSEWHPSKRVPTRKCSRISTRSNSR